MILDFERPVRELEEKIDYVGCLVGPDSEGHATVARLRQELEETKRGIYARLSPYQRVQLARHPERPGFRAYVEDLTEDFYELSGDRAAGDDPAVRGGLARICGHDVVLVGHDKGTDTRSRVASNFGMAHPEGYRKVKRLYDTASKLGLPIVTLVDTPGAFAGRGAEERGQAWAISEDLVTMASAPVPVVSVVIGEGGSGGALAMCISDYVGMLENSYLSVIAPESCASIIFRDSSRAGEAAEALKITAKDLLSHGIVDEVIAEPLSGAHHDPGKTTELVGESIGFALRQVCAVDPAELIEARYERYRTIGDHVREGERTNELSSSLLDAE